MRPCDAAHCVHARLGTRPQRRRVLRARHHLVAHCHRVPSSECETARLHCSVVIQGRDPRWHVRRPSVGATRRVWESSGPTACMSCCVSLLVLCVRTADAGPSQVRSQCSSKGWPRGTDRAASAHRAAHASGKRCRLGFSQLFHAPVCSGLVTARCRRPPPTCRRRDCEIGRTVTWYLCFCCPSGCGCYRTALQRRRKCRFGRTCGPSCARPGVARGTRLQQRCPAANNSPALH